MLSPRGKWILKNISGDRILDVGFTGSGNEQDGLFQTIVATFPDKYVAGVDINRKKVNFLKRRNTFVGDGRKMLFRKNSFDCVILAEVIEHQTDVTPFLREAFRVLKKHGVFLITTPNPYGLFRWLKHFLLSQHPASKKNVNQFLGYFDHKMFFEPLSILNLLYQIGFSKTEYTSVHPSVPYLMSRIREPDWNFWPINRLGTYSCFKATK